ncbi:hypothetical protein L1987_75379 [Smallanthus sonchifolius]|uniref:Uncharacterized protein n=1 Tax=Smallanthus sonchifolius TaxID=185202 RepID=A0ACB9A6I7_9ASTR|nr:hypothetical protein L1987_75379 [Smallanthus sonchifolius]
MSSCMSKGGSTFRTAKATLNLGHNYYHGDAIFCITICATMKVVEILMSVTVVYRIFLAHINKYTSQQKLLSHTAMHSFSDKSLIDYRALTRVICQRADVDPTHRHTTKVQRSHSFSYRIFTNKREKGREMK